MDNRESGCEHKYTFKKEYLFQNVNTVFSKKTCEKCGKTIVLSRRSKIVIIMFTLIMVIMMVLLPNALKQVLPDISYFAKAMVVVFIFCVIYGTGLFWLMNRATYVTYTQSSRYRDAFEKARRENDERARQRYEQAMLKREEKRAQKQIDKKS